MMNYQQLLSAVLNSSKTPVIHGKAILFVWNDEDHLKEWYSCQNVNSQSLRIATLPSEFLPMVSTGNANRNDVCIIALCLGIQKDYSDTRCIFHMIVKNQC